MNQIQIYSVFQLKTLTEQAVCLFLRRDIDLLTLEAHEQAITHRIAVYLEQVFNNSYLNFDCEYNKSLKESKSFVYSRNVRCDCKSCKGRKCRERSCEEKKFRPDIVVHKRNKHDNNLLAIELKRDKNCRFDEEKVITLTHPGDDYKYKLGLCLHFKDNKPVYNWFIDGKKQE